MPAWVFAFAEGWGEGKGMGTLGAQRVLFPSLLPSRPLHNLAMSSSPTDCKCSTELPLSATDSPRTRSEREVGFIVGQELRAPGWRERQQQTAADEPWQKAGLTGAYTNEGSQETPQIASYVPVGRGRVGVFCRGRKVGRQLGQASKHITRGHRSSLVVFPVVQARV